MEYYRINGVALRRLQASATAAMDVRYGHRYGHAMGIRTGVDVNFLYSTMSCV